MSFDKVKYIDGYNRATYKMYQFRVRRDDKRLINYLDNLENRTNYILALIKKDMGEEVVVNKKVTTTTTKHVPDANKSIVSILKEKGIKYVSISENKDSIDITCEKGKLINLMRQADLEEELSDLTNKIVNIKILGNDY